MESRTHIRYEKENEHGAKVEIERSIAESSTQIKLDGTSVESTEVHDLSHDIYALL